MAGFEIKRTELVWPGKYDENGKRREVPRVDLPFQVIERVNESRASREAAKERRATLFDLWEGDAGETFEAGWRNKLIWGDNLLVARSLLEQLAGSVDLVYIDPPFAVGADFSLEVAVGDEGEGVLKEQSLLEERAYRDTWGSGLQSYLEMMRDRLLLIHDLLSDKGAIYVHCDHRVNSHLRLLLDEIFGAERFQREIIWVMSAASGYKGMVKNYVRGHETILYYSKTASPIFNKSYLPYSEEQLARFSSVDEDGRRYKVITKTRRLYLDEAKGVPLPDVWADIANFQTIVNSPEITGYPTQKPEALLRRIIESSSDPGDLVADFFVGSGTTAAVAEKLGRRWIGCDLGRYAIHVSRKRLLSTPDCRPFEVLNLGKYERQHWSVAKFGEDLDDDDGAISLLEYIAFILRLYGATATAGSTHVHGQTGDAFVHVGAVDAPVTFNEVAAAVSECVALNATELHVLGWEWEMGLNDLVSDEATKQGVKVVLRQIPREVMEAEAARKGDVQFFELAYLEASVEPTKAAREYLVKLENFVIPNPELVPEDVREKITKWSDFVDYWAIDWDFRDDTFMQGWVTYRTRRDRSLHLVSDPHVYEDPGEYRVMVKVIDVFGNDTSKLVTISVD